MRLQKRDSGFLTGFHGRNIPYTGLNFSDMGTAHHEHGQSGLANTTANSKWKLIIQKHFMERKGTPFITAGFPELPIQGLRIYTDSHR